MANAGSQTKTRKRIMRSFTMNEISGVDNPAQPLARVTLMKRLGDNDGDHSDDPVLEAPEKGAQFGKQAALSSAEKGHSHLLRLDSYDGVPRYEGETSHQAGHSHPWIMDAEGKITIGEVAGHTHDIQAMGKLSEEGTLEPSDENIVSSIPSVNKSQEEQQTMADENKKGEEASAELKAVQASLAKSQAIVGLSADHRAHYDALSDADQDAFLAKSADERQVIIDDAANANKVVYKSLTGEEFTAQDDPRMVAMAKRADEDRKALNKERADRADADLRKRAETDLANLPGDVDTHVALLKAAESIEDEDARNKAVAALKSQSIELGKAQVQLGYAGNGSRVVKSGNGNGDADQELNTLAKAYAKENNVPEAAAYDVVIQSGRGAELYAQTLN